MSKITVLDDHLKNKIAAGEVIERPASVVRELIENSLDAGATSVEVEARAGGVKLMRVDDDGEGMEKEDALLSIHRHATSKLSSEDDLYAISTMGFRGEALPSIASVSRLTMSTAPRGASSGVSLEAEGGEVLEIREAAASGTSFEVRDLFFNTPARRKFLKRESTELGQVVDAVSRLALSHPEVRFVLRADGAETINLPRAKDLRERFVQIYGAEFVEGLVEFHREFPGLRVRAFVSRPANFRSTRAHQLLFINRRPVREPSINHAVYSALEGILPKDLHPIYFIFIEADPSIVDFNVHPQKREVRFQNKEAPYRLVKRGVMEAMRAENVSARSAGEDSDSDSTGVAATETGEGAPYGLPAGTGAASGGIAESLGLAVRAELPQLYLGETFVAVAGGGGLTIIDHHAAHERVQYERFLKGLKLDSHQLLFPRQVKLSPREYMALLEHREMLSEFGIEIEDFGRDTVIVRSLPDVVHEADVRGILADAAQEMLEGGRPGRTLRESVAARIACHRSVRGSVVLGAAELRALIDDLEACDDPEHCPHGRPTRVFYGMDDIKKLFKRK